MSRLFDEFFIVDDLGYLTLERFQASMSKSRQKQDKEFYVYSLPPPCQCVCELHIIFLHKTSVRFQKQSIWEEHSQKYWLINERVTIDPFDVFSSKTSVQQSNYCHFAQFALHGLKHCFALRAICATLLPLFSFSLLAENTTKYLSFLHYQDNNFHNSSSSCMKMRQ